MGTIKKFIFVYVQKLKQIISTWWLFQNVKMRCHTPEIKFKNIHNKLKIYATNADNWLYTYKIITFQKKNLAIIHIRHYKITNCS